MPLQSDLLKGDSLLEDCLVRDSAHVTPGASGDHVSKIQSALSILDHISINSSELSSKTYGPAIVAAVLAFKRKRSIINFTYEKQVDNIVGKMTIKRMDDELARSSPAVAKDLAVLDKPAAENLVRVALRNVASLAKDLELLGRASVNLGTPPWDALATHFHLLPAVTSSLGRAVTNDDLNFLRDNFQGVLNVFFNSAFTFDNGPPAIPGSPASGTFAAKIRFSPLYKDFDTADGARIGPNSRAAILIHEAIHLVDNQSGPPNHISEFDPAYATMAADSAIHNASSYATFAWHVARGVDFPRFGLGPARAQ